VSRLTPLIRFARSPRTRHLMMATLRSRTARDLARRAVTDPRGLVREAAAPGAARRIIRERIQGTATALGGAAAGTDRSSLVRLARTGLIFLPFRYVPAGYVAVWAGGKILRRLDRRRRQVRTTAREPAT
jgi:hypothetical protein